MREGVHDSVRRLGRRRVRCRFWCKREVGYVVKQHAGVPFSFIFFNFLNSSRVDLQSILFPKVYFSHWIYKGVACEVLLAYYVPRQR